MFLEVVVGEGVSSIVRMGRKLSFMEFLGWGSCW